MNQFLVSAQRHDTLTEKGAVAHSTTGSSLVDQFGKVGSYRSRDISVVMAEQGELDSKHGVDALKFVFYLRMITRPYDVVGGLQRGQGVRDEAFKRYIWYLINKPEVFYNNLQLFPIVGRWKDLWEIMVLCELSGFNVKYDKVFEVIGRGLQDDDDLVLKYVPSIISTKKIKSKERLILNGLGKRLATYLRLNDKEYRKMKSSGKAHVFQQKISRGEFDKINFDHVPGRALSIMVGGKAMEKYKQVDRYLKWLDSKPVAKFNGYPYELLKRIKHGAWYQYPKRHISVTINKQFKGLIERDTENGNNGLSENVWVCCDTSGSMWFPDAHVGNELYAGDVCISLGIYFSNLNTGTFKDHVVLFSNNSKLLKLGGEFVDKAINISKSMSMGSTNFQSVVDLLISTRKRNPDIPLEDYPTTFLVVSDLQFDVPERNWDTNYESMIRKISAYFPSEYTDKLKFVWWDCTPRKTGNVPSTIDDKGTYVFSGFDGSIISLLLGDRQVKERENKQLTMKEMVDAVINQPILDYVVW